jgi:hypothetical protein
MASMPTTNTAITAAQRILDAVAEDAKVAELIKVNHPAVRSLNMFNRQNILRTTEVFHTWKQIGRQVLAMHPEVVEETKVATSDSIPTDVLRTLPYMNPMVVYADPPEFKTWLAKGVAHPVTGQTEAKMRLLGFLCYGTTEKLGQNNKGFVANAEQFILATNDEDANRFGLLVVFETLDEDGKVVDYEMNSMSVYYGQTMTLAQVVEDLLDRFHFDAHINRGNPNARKWMRNVLGTIMGSLFYLCSTTLEAERVPAKGTRHLGRSISRKPLSMFRIGWTTGAALTRYRAQQRTNSTSEQGDIAHQQDPQHRRSHFKLQPCGKGRTERKLIFVSAYWTHRERLGEEGVNTARRVPRVNGKGAAKESTRIALGMK